jgi:uncharacterized phage infection (PIP) family protein YhgE
MYSILSQRLKKVEDELNDNIQKLNKEITNLTNSTNKLATDTILETYSPWNRPSGVRVVTGDSKTHTNISQDKDNPWNRVGGVKTTTEMDKERLKK